MLVLILVLAAANQTADSISSHPSTTQGAKKDASHVDSYGIPLPGGAISRLGDARFRHGGRIHKLSFSPDGKKVASAGFDRYVSVWEVSTGRELVRLPRFTSHRNTITFSPDGSRLLVGTQKDGLALWNPATGKKLLELKGHEGWVHTVQFSPDGALCASGGSDNAVIIWNVETGAIFRRLPVHSGQVLSLAFSPNGRNIISGGVDRQLRLWEVKTGRYLRSFLGHTHRVTSVAFFPDGKKLASASGDFTYPAGTDGNSYLSGFGSGMIRLWDLKTGKETRSFKAPGRLKTQVRVSPDGRTLLYGSDAVHLWDISKREEALVLNAFGGEPWAVAFSPDGRTIARSASAISLWDLDKEREIISHGGHAYSVMALAFHPSKNTIITGGSDGTLREWNTRSGKQLQIIRDHKGGVTCLYISRDGRYVVSADDKAQLFTRKTDNFEDVDRRLNTIGPVYSLGFSADGNRVAIARYGGPLVVTLRNERRDTVQFEKGNSLVVSVGISANGKLLVAGSEDRTISIWDTGSKKEILKLPETRQPAVAVELSPKKKILASWHAPPHMSSYALGIVRLWDLSTGQKLREFVGRGLSFSPDGRYLATGGNALLVIDIASGQVVFKREGPKGRVINVAFSAEGNLLATGNEDGTVLVWEFPIR